LIAGLTRATYTTTANLLDLRVLRGFGR